MLTLLCLCLLLTTFSTLVSSKPTSLTVPAVYNNCSGDYPLPLPDDQAAFKPQIRVNPLEIGKNGTGWEEWAVLSHNSLPDGTVFVLSYKWALGEPTSANVSSHAFTVWAHFPNGTFYHQEVRDIFKYEEHADGGFTYSIANNHFTWDPVYGYWNTSINAEGWIIEARTETVEPGTPFAPNYNSVPGQISDGFFSRMDTPRGHPDGYMILPSGVNITLQSIGSMKHTWSNKRMADAISAYVRGTTFFPNSPLAPISTVNWFQAWDPSGKEIDAMQFLLQPDNATRGQIFRIQITDVPKVLSIVTTPTPASLPLSYHSTELTLPMCGLGADFDHTDQKMHWNVTSTAAVFEFIDFAGGMTLYHSVNITGVLWYDGAPVEVAGGVGIVEVYHR